MTDRPRLAITMGDPAGIGPEIVLRGLAAEGPKRPHRPLLVGSLDVFDRANRACGLGLDLRSVDPLQDTTTGDGDIIDVVDLGPVDGLRHGVIDARHGAAAVQAIEHACALALDGTVQGIVTAPINKEALKAAGSPHPGHTEMLAVLLGRNPAEVVTVFVLDEMRVFFLSRHLSLADAITWLTVDRVLDGIQRTHDLCAVIGRPSPHIALAALNPHGGENGLHGREEMDVLAPAVEQARARGIDVVGPVPADSVYYQSRLGRYDAVISLYHDQGHIATKTVDFFGTVSATLGLPVIRTSVDHGTAFDIAGTWVADGRGQVAACRVAAELAGPVSATSAA
jgi:4-hydroxythreonine-4-phosphate dehydrogenase